MQLLWVLLAILPASLQAQGVPGSYAIWLCKESCSVEDTASAPVAGYLVLFDGPVPLDALAPEVTHRLVDRSEFLLMPNLTPTACFALRRRTSKVEITAGIIPQGLTSWSMIGDTLLVKLYASPDASYRLRAVVQSGRLLGVGRESGFITTSFDKPMGPAHGVRLGPPDIGHCRAIAGS